MSYHDLLKQGFKVTDVNFQRNGVSGRGFYVVRFSFTNTPAYDGKFYPNMMAVMPDEATTENGIECYVIDLNDPTSGWRGDYFSELVRAAIVEHHSKKT